MGKPKHDDDDTFICIVCGAECGTDEENVDDAGVCIECHPEEDDD